MTKKLKMTITLKIPSSLTFPPNQVRNKSSFISIFGATEHLKFRASPVLKLLWHPSPESQNLSGNLSVRISQNLGPLDFSCVSTFIDNSKLPLSGRTK